MGRFLLLIVMMLFLWACSFDYGPSASDMKDQPDIVMRDVEYVRVRDGDPTVRFHAELAERYESRQSMELRNFSFEQFDTHNNEVNALGRAGSASVELDSGNISLDNGIRIEIESEDIIIETTGLDWHDKERDLLGEEDADVNILRDDGTSFTGRGFSANARTRTWEFTSGVAGIYIHEDDEEAAEDEALPEDEGGGGGDDEDTPEGSGDTAGEGLE